MSKIIGKYEFEDVTDSFDTDYHYGWLHLMPTIEFRHKYWYMWEFNFKFWKWNKRIEITHVDWDKYPEKDEKLFWKKIKKLEENGVI